ncbi:MAG TPA: hypothetical protein VNY06_01015, partial [Methylocella sp.]|nr:hypothetical protein [Methylocella sp.]
MSLPIGRAFALRFVSCQRMDFRRADGYGFRSAAGKASRNLAPSNPDTSNESRNTVGTKSLYRDMHH